MWDLDEMVVRINGQRMYMWRAVDKEGEVLDVLVQKRRNKAAALKLPRKLLKNQGAVPDAIVTDSLNSYPAVKGLWAASTVMRRGDYGTKIGRKPPVYPSEDGSETCSASSRKVRPSASFQPTP